MFKRIVTALLAVVFLLAVALPIGVSAAGEKPYIQTSDVLEDLQKMSVGGKDFNINDYPANKNDDTIRLISFIEYGYAQNGNHGQYNLYFYLYNPSLKPIYQHADNKVQLSFGDVDRYEKYPLRIIDSTSDNLFYKLCLLSTYQPSTGTKIPYSSNMSSLKRVYKISGIELMTDRSVDQIDFKIAGTYTYSGFGEGFRNDPKAKSTLHCEAEGMLTLSLDLNYTYFRPEERSTSGAGHRNDLNTVYFTVPNSVWENYGYLYSIQGEYYKYRIASIVSENEEAINDWKNDIGKPLSEIEGAVSGSGKYVIENRYGFAIGFLESAWGIGRYEKAFNFQSRVDIYKDYLDIVPYMFHFNNIVSDQVVITSTEILQAAQDYGVHGVAENDGKLVQYDIKFDDSFDLDTYNTADLDFWSNIWFQLGLLTPAIDADYQDVPALQDVKYNEKTFSRLTDQEIADRYYVNLADVPTIRHIYREAAAKGENLVFLHFDVSDSYTLKAVPALYVTSYPDMFDDLSYYYEQAYYKDFDVLSLTFTENYSEFTVIPTSVDPIDGVADQTPTLDDDKFELPEYGCGQLFMDLPVILGILGVVFILFLFRRPLKWIFKKSKKGVKKLKERKKTVEKTEFRLKANDKLRREPKAKRQKNKKYKAVKKKNKIKRYKGETNSHYTKRRLDDALHGKKLKPAKKKSYLEDKKSSEDPK